MKPSEVIDKALTEVIPDESKWCKGILEGEDDTHCMAGSMMVAAHGSVGSYMASRLGANSPYFLARRACMNVIEEVWKPVSIPHFNDTKTYIEVRAIMEKARAGLQEQGL